MTQDHRKTTDSGEENITKPQRKKSGHILSSKKRDPKETDVYWTQDEMARAKPRPLSRKPKKSKSDDESLAKAPSLPDPEVPG